MPSPRNIGTLTAALAAVASAVVVYARWLHVTNPLTVGFTLLLIVLLAAASARFWVAAATSIVATFALNFFFLPPVGTLYLADPQNWVALVVFLAVSLVASNLSTAARARAREAIGRQDELARLFDLSRDVLLTTDSSEAISQLAEFIARRFALEFAAICLPRSNAWDIWQAGAYRIAFHHPQLDSALGAAQESREFDARARSYTGHRTLESDGHTVRLIPLRSGTDAIGLLAVSGRVVEAGTADALAGFVGIAIERAQFLEARSAAEVARRSEELKSALLASLSHDLRTPLTAIRVAADNLQCESLDDAARREQTHLIVNETERLQRLFTNILELARIEAGAVSADRRWVHPSEIVQAACDQVDAALRQHVVDAQIESDLAVHLDPRLTSAALAHVLENAAQYTSPGSTIAVKVRLSGDGLTITVRDHGAGITAGDLPHLFDRFFRGQASRRRAGGSGMGLPIARGMLAAEGGRLWAENCPDGGAQFTLIVPAAYKATAALESAS